MSRKERQVRKGRNYEKRKLPAQTQRTRREEDLRFLCPTLWFSLISAFSARLFLHDACRVTGDEGVHCWAEMRRQSDVVIPSLRHLVTCEALLASESSR